MRKTAEVRKMRDIGDAVRKAREARGLSQKELAMESKCGRWDVDGLETGRGKVDIDTVLRILGSLGLTVSITLYDSQSR